MLAIQCKLCGGDIEITPGEAIGTCAYCGSANTYPKTEDESRILAFNDANNLRRAGEFDKALAIYEKMLEDDPNDAELHWCCALSRFGIVYEEDMSTFSWVPTCHRTSLEIFTEDADYLAAIQNFGGIEQRRCQQDAEKIADVERQIRQESQDIDPYDVFITCKAEDNTGNRTEEGRVAGSIYEQLTEKGLRVFYAPETLSGQNSTRNQAMIYAAMNSAKAMLLIGTKEENIESAWVKNDWSRFLRAGKRRGAPIILCTRGISSSEVPKALSAMPTCDLGKESFVDDLFEELREIFPMNLNNEPEPEPVPEPVSAPEPTPVPMPEPEVVSAPEPVEEPELSPQEKKELEKKEKKEREKREKKIRKGRRKNQIIEEEVEVPEFTMGGLSSSSKAASSVADTVSATASAVTSATVSAATSATVSAATSVADAAAPATESVSVNSMPELEPQFVSQSEPEPVPVPIPEPEPEPEVPIEDLLDEGYRHLSTSMWEMADECFKQVLAREPKNGRAYFGQYLKENKYISDEHMAAKIQQEMDIISGDPIPFKGDSAELIQELVKKYEIPNYLEHDVIAEKVRFSDEYASCVKKQNEYYEEVKTSIENNQLIARACSDNEDGFGDKLNDFLGTMMNELLQSVKKSEQKDEASLVRLQKRYEDHLAQAKEEIAALHNQALEQKENDYMEACGQMSEAGSIEEYEKLSVVFDKLKGYKNADQFKQHCDNKVLHAAMKGQKVKKKKGLIIAGCSVVIVGVIAALVLPKYLKYTGANSDFQAGNYDKAIETYSELGSYLSSQDKLKESIQKYAEELQSKGAYDQAEQLITSNFTGFEQEQMLQQLYVSEAASIEANTTTNVFRLRGLLELLKDDKDKEVVQDKLDEYFFDKGNIAAGEGNFNTAIDCYEMVQKINKDEAKKMLDVLEGTKSNVLYSYIKGVTWKLDSCTYGGKSLKEDVTKFAGVHVRIEDEKAIFYVTFDDKDVDLKNYSSISNINVKVGSSHYTLKFGGNTLVITGKTGGKKVVSKLSY